MPGASRLDRDTGQIEQPSILRIESKLADRLAVFAIDRQRGDLPGMRVEFLVPLP